jgi:tetratricopeptide (TPR) repeat protein
MARVLRPISAGRFGAVLVAIAGSTACAGGPQVVRVFDGQAIAGPYIGEEAYGAYARGAVLEASGDDRNAAVAYERALDSSPESAPIWVRLGAVKCRLGTSAQPAFVEARRLDPEYAPLWREWARCSFEHGLVEPARPLAERALALDPDDEQTTLLLAAIERKLGRRDRATALLVAQGVRDSGSGAVWRAVLTSAQRTKDPSLAALARAGLDRARLPDPSTTRAASLGAAIDRALLADELDLARQLAPRARLSGSALAIRAVLVGAPRAALNQSDFVLDADPGNTDAWIAGLVAADLLGDDARFEDKLAQGLAMTTRPSGPAARLYAELLERRLGADAARAWRQATGKP